MITPVNNDHRGLALETHRAQADWESSITKLSSGKRVQDAVEDSGAFQQAAKLISRNKRDHAAMQNLQNLISYSQTQDGSLQAVGEILNRMSTLSMRALDLTSTDADRENYNKEFIELATQLDEIKAQKFNGMDLFGAGGFSDAKKEFMDSLKNGWLKRSEELINTQYGWSVNANDGWDLIVNENDTGGYAAFVMTSWDNTGTANVIEMQFDLPDFSAPHTQPNSTADRVVAHEMVHVMQAQNSFYGDIIGDGSSRGTWFKEGLAELIHGADGRVFGILGAAPGNAQIDALTAAIGNGNEGWSTNDQYASAYLAARYLDFQIKASGEAQGIKHLTRWMENRFNNVPLATAADDYKGVNGRNYINTQIVPNLGINDPDTGSIGGSDANGGPALDATAVVPDTAGTADSNADYEVEKGSLAATVDGSGDTWNLQTVNTVTISDTATYNLENLTNAKATLKQLDDWLENLAEERARIGANLSRLTKESDNLSKKIEGFERAIGRIEDTDVARESSRLVANQVRTQASVAILSQGKQSSVKLADLIRGVNVGG
jgi:flagellin